MTLKEFWNNSRYLKWENIFFLPCFHGKVEFTLLFHRLFREISPDVIAIELPESMKEKVRAAVRRFPYISVVIYEEKKGAFYLPVEPSDCFMEAVRSGEEFSLPVKFVDEDVENYPAFHDAVPDMMIFNNEASLKYLEIFSEFYGNLKKSSEDNIREQGIALRLSKLSEKYKRILYVSGFAHVSSIIEKLQKPLVIPFSNYKRGNGYLANLHQDSIREISTEIPLIMMQYEKSRGSLATNQNCDNPFFKNILFKREEFIINVIKEASELYSHNTKETISLQRKNNLIKFARNYAKVDGLLLPDLYHLVIAAKGCVDDEFGYEVWNLLTKYDFSDNSGFFPTVRVRLEDLLLEGRKIKLLRKLNKFKRRLISVPVKKRKKEKYPGEWSKEIGDGSICSHIPEDLVLEGYADFLKKTTGNRLMGDNTRTEQFQTSMLDGIDLRETLRNFHLNKLFVKEQIRVKGEISSIILIFDEGDEKTLNEKYPLRMTLLGEHYQESDLSFFGTESEIGLVGPGIRRMEYGGFLLTYPPFRQFEIWKDSDYHEISHPAEKLLVAGIDYCSDKFILYISKTAPRSYFSSYAARLGKKVLYLPIGCLSPVMLKKIRVFHILTGKNVRDYAKNYI